MRGVSGEWQLREGRHVHLCGKARRVNRRNKKPEEIDTRLRSGKKLWDDCKSIFSQRKCGGVVFSIQASFLLSRGESRVGSECLVLFLTG